MRHLRRPLYPLSVYALVRFTTRTGRRRTGCKEHRILRARAREEGNPRVIKKSIVAVSNPIVGRLIALDCAGRPSGAQSRVAVYFRSYRSFLLAGRISLEHPFEDLFLRPLRILAEIA